MNNPWVWLVLSILNALVLANYMYERSWGWVVVQGILTVLAIAALWRKASEWRTDDGQ